MTKVTLDMDTFKALASDTRLDILRTLDGKKLSLKDISTATKLNKATLHEHLAKLNEAGLVKKKEREGHKWVVYKLTWKGESLLHPENTRIVVMFATTFIALWVGVIQLLWYVKGTIAKVSSGFFYYPQSKVGDDIFYPSPPGPGYNTTVPLYNNSRVASESMDDSGSNIIAGGSVDGTFSFLQDPLFLYIAIACFIIFIIVLCVAVWRLWENKTPKL